ncbi:hypothetical protein KFL_000910040 [Klebsormidium nitens]|uniref:Uncharacterized protein n=1 Tax=Klebsormidium nitens TaxID=105231 RepID=A0A1Y1HUH8_KLENI|nr:hypothetical protein KFL_000910040 [Klebsormidium nitens]|eukprot:GAQ81783.1 hypothetical protein KFL_000910040 [Klebsormidium nitens]
MGQGRAEKKEGGAKRQGVNYRMDMDYVELPPVQVAVNDLHEFIEEEDSNFPEFNEQVQDLITMTGMGVDPADPTLASFGLAIVPGRRRVSGSDLEEAGLASVSGTVDAQQLQREVFRSGPFYAQWFERWRSGWVVTGYLDGDPAETRARLQARLDQHFPELKLVVFLLNTPQEVPWCLILPADEPVAFAVLPEFRQAAFASAVVSALVMWICKGIAIADPLLLKGEEAAIALAALPLGLLSILFTGSVARSAVASLYGVRDRFPIPLPMPGLGAIGMTAGLRGVLPSRAALIDIPLAGSLATAVTSVAMITSSHSWLAWRFPQSGPLILVPPETLHHSFVLSYLVFQLQKASVVGPGDVIYMAIHPLAFAGLLGLNATALSLLPLSKTDGGRIAQGLFGRQGHLLATAATFALVLVGFIFGDTALSVALYAYNWNDNRGEWYQKDEVSDVGFLRTFVAFVTMALGVIVLSPTFSWIPFHSLVKSANHVQTLLPTWGNM